MYIFDHCHFPHFNVMFHSPLWQIKSLHSRTSCNAAGDWGRVFFFFFGLFGSRARVDTSSSSQCFTQKQCHRLNSRAGVQTLFSLFKKKIKKNLVTQFSIRCATNRAVSVYKHKKRETPRLSLRPTQSCALLRGENISGSQRLPRSGRLNVPEQRCQTFFFFFFPPRQSHLFWRPNERTRG